MEIPKAANRRQGQRALVRRGASAYLINLINYLSVGSAGVNGVKAWGKVGYDSTELKQTEEALWPREQRPPALTAVQMLERQEELAGEMREHMALIRRNLELEARPMEDLLELPRILLVEDHAETAKVMERLLKSIGYHVRCADSVAAAFAVADRERFDLLLSDIGLSDGSGLDVMRRVAKRVRRIVVTAPPWKCQPVQAFSQLMSDIIFAVSLSKYGWLASTGRRESP